MYNLTRKSNWPELLENLLRSLEREPQQYGKHDCCCFVSKVLCTLTVCEVNPAKSFGTYSTAKGALKIIKKAGCKTIRAFIVKQAKALGMKKVAPALAQRGDIVISKDVGGDYAAGVCVGSHAAFAFEGIQYVPMGQIVEAWHYG